jgi:alkanesulfonate monooxygenase SsuD/methylene tetrahydromethanopterin reductase-like flavin-dependent oxidoreductase (luciferase family)
MTGHLHLGVALDGYGWHPEAWRHTPDGEPVTSGRYWSGLAITAERGLLDFVTFDDALTPQRRRRAEIEPRWLAGRPDAVLIASRVAPVTSYIGLIPVATVTHTEPFHVSKAIATLDFVSHGRAGWQVRVSGTSHEAELFGRRDVSSVDLFGEASDAVEVARRLWDSWEDDAEIRDAATGRFVDRDKLHYIDFSGPHFSVRGPSITPRPPQGQPLVSALAHRTVAYRLLARSADLGFVTPRDATDATAILAEIRTEQGRVDRDGSGRADAPLHVLGDLVVFLDEDASAAADRRARLDELAGAEFTSDARIFTGTPAELADLVQEWHAAGLSGMRLRPAGVAHDLPLITRGLVPELQRRGAFRTEYEADTLRGLFGLDRPANRYAAV